MHDQRYPWNDPRQAHQAGYQQGHQEGQAAAGNHYDIQLRETAQQLREDFDRRINQVAGMARKQGGSEMVRLIEHKMELADQKLDAISRIAQCLEMSRGSSIDAGTVRIEEIPGRRVPFTLLVEIPIGNNVDSIQAESILIPQEGPFVAVRRQIAFLSQYEFNVTDPTDNSVARFPGRSFGRWRPTSSATDVLDSNHNAQASTDNWFLTAAAGGLAVAGVPLPCGVLAQASSASSFRTMQFDGRIEMENAGSGYPRQNEQVPSAWWSTAIQAPWELGALDFFERGELIRLKVLPTHINNAPAGNVDGSCVFPLAAAGASPIIGYPFLDGQFDPHEGICTPDCVTVGSTGGNDDFVPLSTDPVVRLPDGILILGFEGYKIIQPQGAAL